MKHQFIIGDKVCLKTNSKIKMTVEKINDDGTYVCFWYDENNKRQTETFPGELLTTSNYLYVY